MERQFVSEHFEGNPGLAEARFENIQRGTLVAGVKPFIAHLQITNQCPQFNQVRFDLTQRVDDAIVYVDVD
ncbi:hypothetical protein D3C87_2140650 [compost metagenome]